jgi:G3E family GTPase
VLVLNKTDLVSEEQLAKVKEILHALNPEAKIITVSALPRFSSLLHASRCVPVPTVVVQPRLPGRDPQHQGL